MENKKNGITILFACVLASVFLLSASLISAQTSGNDTMIVSVNILDFEDRIEIEVPNTLSFGNITRDDLISEELKVYVNNTGNLDVTVTPELADSSEDIFSYLYLRDRKSGVYSNFSKIGNYSFDVSYNDDEYFYVKLDLSEYTGDITEDIIDHTAEIVFYAVAS